MSTLRAIGLLFFCLTTLSAQPYAITPKPAEIRLDEGKCTIGSGAFVHARDTMDPRASIFAKLSEAAGFALKMAPADASCAIQFLSADMLASSSKATKPQGEGYVIWIRETTINAYAATPAGHFNAQQTVLQLLEGAKKTKGSLTLPCGLIEDSPRFAWRGFMLDESRHFTGVDGVKRILDAMARYKLNRFHWHLTDSPGWRIEIKKYPKLTSIGGRGSETNRSPDAPVEFYTQEQIREILAYAKERHITVIPEIDMPGHADAAVLAYPEHDGGGFTKKDAPDKWPHFTFNPAKPETLAFLKDILTEVSQLFPDAGVIHFGGDEVHFGWKKWPELPEVQALMKREGFTELPEIERWFNQKIASDINELGLTAAGWDEIADDGLDVEKTLVFWWRHDKVNVLQQALESGHQVVLCPRRPLYFDFLQDESHKVGRRWGGIVPIEDTYRFPDSLEIDAKFWPQVQGLQACLWTEAAATQARRDFLTWPRLIAVGEASWTAADNKDLDEFMGIIPREVAWLRAHGIAAWDPIEKSPEVTE